MRGTLVLWVALVCGASGQEIRFTQVAAGISGPTDIQNASDGSGRLFLVQQNGIVRVLRGGALDPAAFLDIRSKTSAGGERGLLGLAFPPGFAAKQRFYVNYTDLSGNTVIAQYRVSGGVADAASETVLLRINQPFSNHNGGQLRFGPDGYLYIGMGDGGGAGDPQNNAQTLSSLLGKMLRVDVESDPGRVRIPTDNPFLSTAGARGEIWAYGLRNPWRFSFDRSTGDLWIGDVGQDAYEEIDFQPASGKGGENYGWNRMEGLHCYRSGCSQQGLTLPVAEYGRNDGCSVTGGFMYRGGAWPSLRGTYIYGDYCSGRLWGLTAQGSGWTSRLLASSGFGITTFGEDEDGEIYVADANRGNIYRIDGSDAPRISSSGVVNAASFVPGLVAGSLATVFGAGLGDIAGTTSASSAPLPATLAGVSVTVNGVAAPLLAVTSGQVNFQAPYEVRGRTTASVVVTRAGRPSNAVDVPVLEAQPGIYTSDGVNAVVVRNSDFSLVTPSRPIGTGEQVFLYASGLGAASNEPATGTAAPGSPSSAVPNVRVTLGGVDCEVPFAGLAPGFVGVYQVNFSAPAGAGSGLQDLVVSAGGASSATAKVPVR